MIDGRIHKHGNYWYCIGTCNNGVFFDVSNDSGERVYISEPDPDSTREQKNEEAKATMDRWSK